MTHDEGGMLSHSLAVSTVPASPKLPSAKASAVSVLLVAVIKSLRGIAFDHAVAGDRKATASVPTRRSFVRWKHLFHLQDRGETSMWTVSCFVLTLNRQISHHVAYLKARREFAGPTQTGNARERMVKIRFTTDRTINERRQLERRDCGSSLCRNNQRSVGV
jgi:hypothetical protein